MQELQGIEVQAGCLQAVGNDSLDSGKSGTEESDEETGHRGIVISKGCETDAGDDWDQRAVGLDRIGGVEHGAVDCDNEDWCCGTHDLVERYSDQGAGGGLVVCGQGSRGGSGLQGDVGDGDVQRIEDGKHMEDENIVTRETGQGEEPTG